MARAAILALGILAAICSTAFFLQTTALSETYYNQSPNFCPQAPAIVSLTVAKYVLLNKNKAAQLLRLHFHDCFVRGCDASVLIDKKDGNSELNGPPNAFSIGGFEIIDDIKTQLEKQCPRTVPCADILALAARDGVAALPPPFRPSWSVPLGRKDGNISLAAETLTNLPPPFFNAPQLIANFAAKNLSIQQLVLLSGAHTIGVSNCTTINSRLYNFTGVGDTDPSLDPAYAAYLKSQCPPNIKTKRIAMKDFIDLPIKLVSSNNTFDNVYYLNVNENKGFFQSDAALKQNSLTKPFVDLYQNNNLKFLQDFGDAMIAMGKIGVSETGYVRRNCSIAFS